jgi:RNA polymerase-binding transcription factor DksA
MEKSARKRGQRRPKAGTEDILTPSPAPPIPRKWQKHYNRMVKLKAQLLDRRGKQAEQAAEDRPNFSLHMADAGTDEYDRDLVFGMMSSEQESLYEIDAAIDRIQKGTYGVCEQTGKPIEKERLEAIPWTRFTAEAEKKLEAEGAVPRARLGERERVQKVSTENRVAEDSEGD